jgi:hypothetical protein
MTFGEKPRTVILQEGFILHRLTGKHNPIGAFWIDHSTFYMFTNSLRQLEISVKKHQAILLDELALLLEWKNTLSRHVKITLRKNIIAHVGEIGPQSSYVEVDASKFAFNSSNAKVYKKVEWRRSKHNQYVIPSIAKAELANSENYGFEINDCKPLFKMKDLHRK